MASSLSLILGKKHALKFVDSLHRAVRLDVVNLSECNGEDRIQKSMTRFWHTAKNVIVFDVGAHTGTWSERLLDYQAAEMKHGIRLFAFEPAQDSAQMLSERLEGFKNKNKINIAGVALSSGEGTAILNVAGAKAGQNSILSHAWRQPTQRYEVSVSTVDRFCSQNEIFTIDYLKMDAEGNDLNVLLGAQTMLGSGKIHCLQFEYNHAWITARKYLKDAFDLLLPFGYHLGKMTRHGILFYENWHPDLETFVENNYLACRPEFLSVLPSIKVPK